VTYSVDRSIDFKSLLDVSPDDIWELVSRSKFRAVAPLTETVVTPNAYLLPDLLFHPYVRVKRPVVAPRCTFTTARV
jgi:hypothetical protein